MNRINLIALLVVLMFVVVISPFISNEISNLNNRTMNTSSEIQHK